MGNEEEKELVETYRRLSPYNKTAYINGLRAMIVAQDNARLEAEARKAETQEQPMAKSA